MAQPKMQLKLQKTRVILNRIDHDCTCSFQPYANNRLAPYNITKDIKYEAPTQVSTDPLRLNDVNTQLTNLLFTTPDCEQAWKYFGTFSWTDGSFTQFSMELEELTPNNPDTSQELTT